MTNFTERENRLLWLAETRVVDPWELEDVAWGVLEGIVYDPHSESQEEQELLPAVLPLIERLATDERLLGRLETMRLNAGIVYATWPGFEALAEDTSPDNQARLEIRRRLGQLVTDTTAGRFDIGKHEPAVTNKVSEALTLLVLHRNDETTGVSGLPAPPACQRIENVDRQTGLRRHTVYAITPDGFTPIFSHWFRQRSANNAGILNLGFGKLMASSARGIDSIDEELMKLSENARVRRAANHAARLLALEAAGESAGSEQLLPDELSWLDRATELLVDLLGDVRPPTPIQ